jgi:hypothetical protein
MRGALHQTFPRINRGYIAAFQAERLSLGLVAPIATYVASMALCQTTGFVENLLRLAGLDWDVPDFSTICRGHLRSTFRIAVQRARCIS